MKNVLPSASCFGRLLAFALCALPTAAFAADYDLVTTFPPCSSNSWATSGTTVTCQWGSITLQAGDRILPAQSLTLAAPQGITLPGSNTLGSAAHKLNLQSDWGSITANGNANSIFGNVTTSSSAIALNNTALAGSLQSNSGSITLTGGSLTGNAQTSGSGTLSVSNATVTGNLTAAAAITVKNTTTTGNIQTASGTISLENTTTNGNLVSTSGAVNLLDSNVTGTINTNGTSKLTRSGVGGAITANNGIEGSNATFGSTVNASSGPVTLKDSSVAGSIQNQSTCCTVTLDNTSVVGNVSSTQGKVVLSNGSSVGGGVTANGAEISGSTVTGSINSGTSTLNVSGSTIGGDIRSNGGTITNSDIGGDIDASANGTARPNISGSILRGDLTSHGGTITGTYIAGDFNATNNTGTGTAPPNISGSIIGGDLTTFGGTITNSGVFGDITVTGTNDLTITGSSAIGGSVRSPHRVYLSNVSMICGSLNVRNETWAQQISGNSVVLDSCTNNTSTYPQQCEQGNTLICRIGSSPPSPDKVEDECRFAVGGGFGVNLLPCVEGLNDGDDHAPPPDHLRIEHNGSGLTCSPETVTVTACMDAGCTTRYTDEISVTLQATGATNLVANDAFDNGKGSFNVRRTTPGNVQLGIAASTPAATNGVRCFSNGVEGSCTLNFATSGLQYWLTLVQ